MGVFVESVDTLESPESVDGALSAAVSSHSFLQRRRGMGHLIVHYQSLGGQTPELVAAVERSDQLINVAARKGFDGAPWGVFPDNAVDASV